MSKQRHNGKAGSYAATFAARRAKGSPFWSHVYVPPSRERFALCAPLPDDERSFSITRISDKTILISKGVSPLTVTADDVGFSKYLYGVNFCFVHRSIFVLFWYTTFSQNSRLSWPRTHRVVYAFRLSPAILTYLRFFFIYEKNGTRSAWYPRHNAHSRHLFSTPSAGEVRILLRTSRGSLFASPPWHAWNVWLLYIWGCPRYLARIPKYIQPQFLAFSSVSLSISHSFSTPQETLSQQMKDNQMHGFCVRPYKHHSFPAWTPRGKIIQSQSLPISLLCACLRFSPTLGNFFFGNYCLHPIFLRPHARGKCHYGCRGENRAVNLKRKYVVR